MTAGTGGVFLFDAMELPTGHIHRSDLTSYILSRIEAEFGQCQVIIHNKQGFDDPHLMPIAAWTLELPRNVYVRTKVACGWHISREKREYAANLFLRLLREHSKEQEDEQGQPNEHFNALRELHLGTDSFVNCRCSAPDAEENDAEDSHLGIPTPEAQKFLGLRGLLCEAEKLCEPAHAQYVMLHPDSIKYLKDLASDYPDTAASRAFRKKNCTWQFCGYTVVSDRDVSRGKLALAVVE